MLANVRNGATDGEGQATEGAILQDRDRDRDQVNWMNDLPPSPLLDSLALRSGPAGLAPELSGPHWEHIVQSVGRLVSRGALPHPNAGAVLLALREGQAPAEVVADIGGLLELFTRASAVRAAVHPAARALMAGLVLSHHCLNESNDRLRNACFIVIAEASCELGCDAKVALLQFLASLERDRSDSLLRLTQFVIAVGIASVYALRALSRAEARAMFPSGALDDLDPWLRDWWDDLFRHAISGSYGGARLLCDLSKLWDACFRQSGSTPEADPG